MRKKGPEEIFECLAAEYADVDAQQLVTWIERYFTLWSRNQWKRERYAPSFHLDDEISTLAAGVATRSCRVDTPVS